MPNDVLHPRAKIVDYVSRTLGSSGVDVELGEDDYTTVISDALELYNATLPRYHREALSVSSAQKRYPFSRVGILGVVHLDFITRNIIPADVDPFDPFVVSLTGPNLGDESYGDIMQRLMYQKQARRVIGSEPEWEEQWETVQIGALNGTLLYEEQLVLYIDVQDNTKVSVQYVTEYIADEDDPRYSVLGLHTIPREDVTWFRRYCVARAKQILAAIRGKFEGIPNPDGGVDPVDWSRLSQEGGTEQQTLEQEIRARRPPLLPVFG
jgi:hypothetical protein